MEPAARVHQWPEERLPRIGAEPVDDQRHRHPALRGQRQRIAHQPPGMILRENVEA